MQVFTSLAITPPLNPPLLLDVRLALKIIGVGILAFLLVLLIVYGFGFGPAGIIAGSAAAGAQSFFFGAFVTAGSWFAVMTSLAMTGSILWVAAAAGVVAMILAWWRARGAGAEA
ncbi:hypothetical protein CTheo_2818 [Ceratobasidium theobromae]|uniref:Transmembrane protein n=1 Tax=Ceratobasidium theobromae TaxID=1582974 RepID=A0A5N5QQ49_9AGAM|nr:hypothetical protein CTheo_2818 [Ceratobasidium theobromae]